MNIRNLLAATLVGAAAASGSAQESDYRFGFCDNTATLGDKMVNIDEAKTIDLAIYLTPDDVARFSNLSFTGVSIGLKSKYNIGNITAWLREDLAGENLASKEASPAVGWRSVKFDSPVMAEEGKGYYVGYTMNLNSPGLALICSQSALTHDGACWIRIGDGEWQDKTSEYGILNIEALIQSDGLPQNDVELTQAAIVDRYLVSGTPFTFEYSLHNVGMQTIKSYTLRIADEEKGVSLSRTFECDIPHDARQSFKELLTFDDLKPEQKYKLTVTIEKPNGTDDQAPNDNSITLPEINSVSSSFVRTVVIEEFTTEGCGNCPGAATVLHTMYASLTEAQKERVAIVCHHAGYGVDRFTQPCDNSYTFFYNNGGRTYAPAYMLDRLSLGSTPVAQVPGATSLKNKVLDRMETEAYYSIEMTGIHNPADSTVTLNFSGKAASAMFANPRITAYLLEDNVLSVNQASANSTYKHNHLIRAYNATWGAVPDWSDEFNYTATATLKYTKPKVRQPKLEDMEIVAFISNYDSTNPNNCEIGNAIKVKLSDLKGNQGVNGISDNVCANVNVQGADGRIAITGEYTSAEAFDLSGRRTGLDNLPAGLYIVRVSTPQGPAQAKVMVK